MEIREVNPNDIEELALLSVTMKQEARDFSHVWFTTGYGTGRVWHIYNKNLAVEIRSKFIYI